MPRFLEDFDDYPHHCVAFDEPWNGWATPVVTLDQLKILGGRWAAQGGDDARLSTLSFNGQLAWGSPVAVVHHWPLCDEDATVLEPDKDGLYHLYDLGFCFVEISDDWNGSEPGFGSEPDSR